MSSIARFQYWVASAYFSQALPYAVVISVSAVFYKNLHLSNDWIAFLTSWFFLPWLLKPLWAPWLEKQSSPKRALIICQLFCAVLCIVMAGILLYGQAVIPLSLASFIIMACLSASFDMLSDAIYIHALPPKAQQSYIGVRTFFYQIARVLCIGGLVMLVGLIAKHDPYRIAWAEGFGGLAMLFVLLALWHRQQLPDVAKPVDSSSWWMGMHAFLSNLVSLPSCYFYCYITSVRRKFSVSCPYF